MELQPEPQDGVPNARDQRGKAIELLDQCRDVLFEYAPVMMHSIDESGRLIGVNRKWLGTLGYEPGEVLGRRSIDFLTEESRAWAVEATLPLFWQTGKAHSIGYEMVKKNGRVLNVLLDAETITTDQGGRVTLATLRDNYDSQLWREASMVLVILVQLGEVRQRFGTILAAVESVAGGQLAIGEEGREQPKESLDELLSLSQDISTKMQNLQEAQGTWVHSVVNQQQELMILASTLELIFGELGEVAAKMGRPPE